MIDNRWRAAEEALVKLWSGTISRNQYADMINEIYKDVDLSLYITTYRTKTMKQPEGFYLFKCTKCEFEMTDRINLLEEIEASTHYGCGGKMKVFPRGSGLLYRHKVENQEQKLMKQYRLKRTWWDSIGNQYEPQMVERTIGVTGQPRYRVVDTNGRSDTFGTSLVENTPKLFEKVKQEEPKRWRAEKDLPYYCISTQGQVSHTTNSQTPFDDNSWLWGNHFRSRDQAIKARNLIEKTLEQFHREEGNYE
jgi:hypothetical protein